MEKRLSEMIQARALIGYEALVTRLGGDPYALLQQSHLPIEALTEPEMAIPLDQLADLYERTASALSRTDFGLLLAGEQDMAIYGPLAEVMRHAGTVGEALEGLTRYFAYHTPGATIDIIDEPQRPCLQVRYRLQLSEGVACRQIVEQSYGMAAKLWSLLAPGDIPGLRISLQHEPLSGSSAYQLAYGCPCEFAQSHDAIWLPKAALAAGIGQADARLKAASESYIANILRRYPLDVSRQVETLIVQQIAFGGASIEHIARQLKMHKRTLQRRLAEQGVFFGDLLDSIRQRSAENYLTDLSYSLPQISGLLGYNEQSSFIRACRRWFGCTPQAYRKQSVTSARVIKR